MSRGLELERSMVREAKCPEPSAGARGGFERGGSKSGEEVREHCSFMGYIGALGIRGFANWETEKKNRLGGN